MRAELHKMPAGRYEAEDFMDSDGITDDPIRIAVAITFDPATGSAAIDFSGSSPQVAGSINAVYPITYSACFYVFRCLLGDDAPVTAGMMNALTGSPPRRNHRQRASSRCSRGRQRRVQSAHRRCPPPRTRPGRSRP